MYERREPEERGDGPAASRTGVSPALVVFGIVAVVAVIFIAQNSERRNVEFLFVDVTTPVWVALLIAVGLGILLDRLIVFWWNRRRKRDA
jgi:uncharacterized integral membrane protein